MIKKDAWGIKLKYPDRKCIECKRYPCFDNIQNCKSDFAQYGCTIYSDGKI